ncbi:PAS domain S-box-containing protein [Sphaerotilus hippei]|uniref:histidine kinase n=1 Tax=Sphaerotilus hippei TaxID=744406 RepID=A0A318H3I9_9BURK|nr:PAS domain S-box protein [Sphaerotilus hippei]PXW96272.1 PAS domain S-box-containing protein [Sphaerotilus hippei]
MTAPETPTAAPPPPPAHGWRWGRVWLGVWLLALAVWMVGSAGAWAERRDIDARRAALQSALEMHAQWLRGVTGQYAALPTVVGQQDEVLHLLSQPGDSDQRDRINRYLEAIGQKAGATALYLMDGQGLTLAASNWRTADSFVGQRYGRRPYFVQAMAGGTGLFYGVGITTSKPGLFIAEPIRQDGRVIGVVAVKVALDSLADSWARSPEPVLLRDERGVSILATHAAWRFRPTRVLSAAEQRWLRDSQAYGPVAPLVALPWAASPGPQPGDLWVRTELGGQPRSFLARESRMPEFGWTLTALSSRDDILQTRHAAWAMATLALAVLGLGALHWRLRARRDAEQREARAALEQRVQDRTRELRDAHAFRHAMEESLLVGMRARDLQGRIIYVNRALCEMVGFEAHELLGRQPPYPYWHPDDLERHWSESNAGLQGQAEPTGYESRVRHRDGHDVITMVYTAALIDAEGVQRGWMSSVVDITEQRRTDDRQRAQEAQLQRSARLAGLGEMASTLAHELNQPLMALSNYAAAANALVHVGPQQLLVESLVDIQAQAQRASEIVRRIRGLVRPGRHPEERFAVADLLASVLRWLQPELQARRARVHSHLPADLPLLHADRVLLEQVLLNLLLNALQSIDDQPAPRRLIDVTARVGDDGHLHLGVADRGPGVAPEHAAHLFDAFFTTKAEGLGLGLKICRSAIESQGGALHWHPRPGGGAVFEFNLPLQR